MNVACIRSSCGCVRWAFVCNNVTQRLSGRCVSLSLCLSLSLSLSRSLSLFLSLSFCLCHFIVASLPLHPLPPFLSPFSSPSYRCAEVFQPVCLALDHSTPCLTGGTGTFRCSLGWAPPDSWGRMRGITTLSNQLLPVVSEGSSEACGDQRRGWEHSIRL